jgi:hypothetical protein
MIATRLTAIRPLRFQLSSRTRRILRELSRGAGWLSLGLGLGALCDLVVRIVA